MDWSNEKALFFIELYEKNPVLWDPKHPDNKNRLKLNEAWLRIQREFDPSLSIFELRKKKESLMSSYRTIRRKIVESQISGGEEYKPSWYAFEAIDRFISSRRETDPSIYSEDSCPMETQPDEDEISNPGDIPNMETVSATPAKKQSNSYTKSRDSKPYSYTTHHKRHREFYPHPELGIACGFEENSEAIEPVSYQPPRYSDLCAIFGQLVAEQLRQLSPRNRILTQGKLSSVLEKAMLEELDQSS